MFAVFLVSGLFHEYILYLFSLRMESDENKDFMYGNSTYFFLWNAFIIAVERALDKFPFFKGIKHGRFWPKKLVPVLVIMLALPIGHWFTDEYVRFGHLGHMSLAVPLLVRLD